MPLLPARFLPSCLAGLALTASLGLPGATLTVTSSADSGAGSLRDTVSIAAPGDTILIDLPQPSTISLASPIAIGKALAIKGLGAHSLTLDGGNGGAWTPSSPPLTGTRIFEISAGPVALSGLRLANAFVSGSGDQGMPTGANGGAIRITGATDVQLTSCTFAFNCALPNAYDDPCGGAIYNDQGTLTLTHCAFHDNEGGLGAAVYNHAGSVDFTNCTLDHNTSDYGGPFFHEPAGRTSHLVHCTVTSNTSAQNFDSGGLAVWDGSIDLRHCLLYDSSKDLTGAFVDLDGNVNAGSFTSSGPNLIANIGTTSGHAPFTSSGDLIGYEDGSVIDPKVAAFDASLSTGGTTATRPLLSSSPAIDQAAGSAQSYDQRWYPRASADIGAFEYGAAPQTLTIQGNISGLPGIQIAYVDGISRTVTTDGSGNYAITVPYRWSGRIAPITAGYTYAADHHAHYELSGSLTNQDFTATPIRFTLSGNAGVAGAILGYTDGIPSTATAAGDGSYSFQVSYNWTGTVTPSATGYTFTPALRAYTNVLADQPLQDFSPAPIRYTISGNAGGPGVVLSYTHGTPMTQVSAGDGSYAFQVNHGWSGEVIPSRNGDLFSPAKRTYGAMTADATLQDFVPTPLLITAESQMAAGTPSHGASITSQPGASYAWSLSSGAITSGQGTASIQFTAGSTGSHTLSCQVTDAAGVVQTASKPITITTYLATVTSANPVYAGTPSIVAAVPALSGGSYAWTLTNGQITGGQGTPRITYTAGTAGTAILMCAVTDSAVTTYGSLNVSVAGSPAEISTLDTVLAGSQSNQAWVPQRPGASYAWSITNGALLSGQGTPTVVFAAGDAGSLHLECTVNLAGVPTTGSRSVTVTAYTARISAPTAAYTGQTGLLAAVPELGGASFAWSISNGTITSGQGTRKISFSASAAGPLGLICDVTTAGGPVQGTRTVTVLASPSTITAEASVVSGTGPHLAYVPHQAGATYAWTVTNGTLTSGQGGYAIGYTAGSTGTLQLDCAVTDATGAVQTASKSLPVTLYTAPLTADSPVAAGAANLRAGVLPKPGASYAWTLSNGTITSGQGTPSITYTAGTAGTATLLCAVTADAVTYGTRDVAILGSSSEIWSPAAVQSGGLGYPAAVAQVPGATYAWSASNGTITAGQNAPRATFTAGDAGTLRLECVVTLGGTPTTATKDLPVLAYAATIADTRVVHAGQTNNLASVVPLAGATYAWTVTNGTITAGQGSPAIRYTAGAEGSLTLQCEVTQGAAVTGSSTLQVKADARTITAPSPLMAGTRGHWAYVPRLSSGTYAWSLSHGTITSGQGTSRITYSAGDAGTLDLECAVTTQDGTTLVGQKSLSVTPYGAAAMTAASPVAAGTAGLSASVLPVEGATYAWSLSSGTITAGQGTPAIIYSAGAAGRVTLLCEVTVGASRAFASRTVVVVDSATQIFSVASVQAGGQGYTASLPAQAGATYAWSITNGAITAGQGTSQMIFTAGDTGDLQIECIVTTGGLPQTASRTLTVAPYTAAISCQIPVYAGQTGITASVPPLPGATYLWAITGGTLTSANGGPSATFTAGGTGTAVLSCEVTTASAVTGTLSIPVQATGTTIQIEASVRAGTSGHRAYVPTQSRAGYTWTITNGTLDSGQGTPSITYTAGAAGTLTLQCEKIDPAGLTTSGSRSIPVR